MKSVPVEISYVVPGDVPRNISIQVIVGLPEKEGEVDALIPNDVKMPPDVAGKPKVLIEICGVYEMVNGRQVELTQEQTMRLVGEDLGPLVPEILKKARAALN